MLVNGAYGPGPDGWATPVRYELLDQVAGVSRGWSESVQRAVAVMLDDGRVLHCRADQLEPAD